MCAGGGGDDNSEEDALEGDWLVASGSWGSSSLGEGLRDGVPGGDCEAKMLASSEWEETSFRWSLTLLSSSRIWEMAAMFAKPLN